MDVRVRVGAYCVVVEDEHLLLVRIAEGYPGAGHWTLPGGGIDFDEQPVDGALRELHEEAGLRGHDSELLVTDSRSFDATMSLRGEPLQWFRILYRVQATGEPHVVDIDGSTDAVAWVPLDEVPSLPTNDLVDLALAHLTRTP